MEHETKISRGATPCVFEHDAYTCVPARQGVQQSNRPDVPAHDFVNVSRYGPGRRKPVINEFVMPLRTLATPDPSEMRRESHEFSLLPFLSFLSLIHVLRVVLRVVSR